jgi:EAL domain-containing protein (putative c-di-GMP-specific phosphodiesterase class I)|tara:strand:+ start:392 stop:553 length:162 start_codon:yes stop_codon:yes gene_type:complete
MLQVEQEYVVKEMMEAMAQLIHQLDLTVVAVAVENVLLVQMVITQALVQEEQV